jgi:integrase
MLSRTSCGGQHAYLKSVQFKGGLVYFWDPPVSLQKAGVFHHTTLGSDFAAAVAKARDWNTSLDKHRGVVNCIARPIIPMSVADLFRKFEISPRFSRYAIRTCQDYSCFYRHIETNRAEDGRLLGELRFSEVTRQVAYSIYEKYVVDYGSGSANKAMSACQAAFNYGMLKFGEITSNPFYQLHKLTSPPRRQRWTDQQLTTFIKIADEMGHPSVGLCALLCMELVQRPGDILSMKWGAYEERDNTWYIRQSKRGAVVRIPQTRRLRIAMQSAKRLAIQRTSGEISDVLICPTVTGKRWHRRELHGDGQANCEVSWPAR